MKSEVWLHHLIQQGREQRTMEEVLPAHEIYIKEEPQEDLEVGCTLFVVKFVG